MKLPSSKTHNRIVNAVIIVLTLFIAASLVKTYFFTSEPESDSLVGSKLSIEGVNWAGAERTLLLVLDKDCAYCRASMPFYRLLAERTAGRNDFRLLGVVNTSAEEGKKYVADNELHVEVIRWYFKRLKISGTPTLILVNSTGEVVNEWKGSLSMATEAEVLTQFLNQPVTSAPENAGSVPAPKPEPAVNHQGGQYGIGVPDLLDLINGQRVTILDLDEREDFAAEHIAQAKNIPKDEIYIRALNELDKASTIVLYTRKYDRLFIGNAEVLRLQGFDKVKILRGGLNAWKEAGLQVGTGKAHSDSGQ